MKIILSSVLCLVAAGGISAQAFAEHERPDTPGVVQGLPASSGLSIDGLLRDAEAGALDAVLYLGDLYFYGDGVRASAFEAFVWYDIAARRGHPAAQTLRARAGRELSPGQRMRAARQAQWWLAEQARVREGDILRGRPASTAPATGVVVLRLQTDLSELGYEVGPIDGVLGQQTSRAIRLYQRAHKLRDDGQMSPALLGHLERQMIAHTGEREAAVVDSASTESATVLVQKALTLLDYSPGPVDGVYGARTREAVRQYQIDHQLPPDGELSVGLMDALREQLVSRAEERVAYQR